MKQSVVKVIPRGDHEYTIVVASTSRNVVDKLSDFLLSDPVFTKMMQSFHCHEFALSEPVLNS